MKALLLFFALSPSLLFAGEEFKSVLQVIQTSSEVDPTLEGNNAVYEFQFQPDNQTIAPAEVNVYYAIDGVNGRQVSKNAMITIPSIAGKHIFQFFYNNQFLEVYTDSLTIESRHRDKYTVNLSSSTIRQVERAKPVIYLYPQLSTDIEVKIDIHGNNPFLYPTYSDSWNFTAEPNGDLTFKDGQTYNYLFWEAKAKTILSPDQTQSGFFVKGDNVIEFLEETLTQAGLNSKEQADFITFWAPRMVQNELNFVHFEFNETCNKYADLEIIPKPDNLYRFYMIWGAVSEEFEIRSQEIEQIDRSGFSVLEWGGQESDIQQSFVNKNT